MNKAASSIETLTDAYFDRYPEEVARHIEAERPADVVNLLEKRPLAQICAVMNRLTPALAAATLEQMTPELFQRVVGTMDLNRAAILISQFNPERQEACIATLDKETSRDIRQLLAYPADQAGHYMDPRVLSFPPNADVGDVIQHIKRLQRKRITDVYLVDDNGRFTGSIPLQDLMLADETDKLLSLVKRDPISIQAISLREEAIELFERGRITSLAVIDYEGRLLGVIRQSAIMRAAEQEASTDIQTMVGVSKDERAFSKVPFAVKKRLPWLHINLVTAFLAAAVVGLFEGTIAKFNDLDVFMPVVAGQSGNTGAQALAVTMRGLVLREVRIRQWPRVLWKEGQVGLINGIAVAVTTCIGVLIWSRSPGLTLVIGLAMVISMVCAGLAGAVIPIILQLFGQDPATSSSIILTTVTDIVGFFSFLGLATILAGLL